MSHTRATLLEITVHQSAAPGTEVLVLSLDPVGGKSVGEGRREDVVEKIQKVSNDIGRCLLTR